jgi:hypothetical protein
MVLDGVQVGGDLISLASHLGAPRNPAPLPRTPPLGEDYRRASTPTWTAPSRNQRGEQQRPGSVREWARCRCRTCSHSPQSATYQAGVEGRSKQARNQVLPHGPFRIKLYVDEGEIDQYDHSGPNHTSRKP